MGAYESVWTPWTTSATAPLWWPRGNERVGGQRSWIVDAHWLPFCSMTLLVSIGWLQNHYL